jgi:DNA-directed RNA polymerase specialized sigma24 family protein
MSCTPGAARAALTGSSRVCRPSPAGHVDDHADRVAAQMDSNAEVLAALATLTARDAEVLRLATWEGLDTDELAYVLGCTRAAAKVRLHRAWRRFAQALLVHDSDARLTAREATT